MLPNKEETHKKSSLQADELLREVTGIYDDRQILGEEYKEVMNAFPRPKLEQSVHLTSFLDGLNETSINPLSDLQHTCDIMPEPGTIVVIMQ